MTADPPPRRRRAERVRGKPIARTLVIEGDDPEEVAFLVAQDAAWRAEHRTAVHDSESALDAMDARKALTLALEGRTIEWVRPKAVEDARTRAGSARRFEMPCHRCAATITMTYEEESRRRRSGETFECPNGHQAVFTHDP